METRVHPLDPLSKTELEVVISTLRSKLDFGHQHLIAMVQVEEPPKSELAKFVLGKSIQRAARVTVLDKTNCEVQESVISVDGVVVSTEVIEGAKAPILSSESVIAIAAVKADPRIVAALEKRGISNVASVQMETW